MSPLGDRQPRQCEFRNGDTGVDRKAATPKRASIAATQNVIIANLICFSFFEGVYQ